MISVTWVLSHMILLSRGIFPRLHSREHSPLHCTAVFFEWPTYKNNGIFTEWYGTDKHIHCEKHWMSVPGTDLVLPASHVFPYKAVVLLLGNWQRATVLIHVYIYTCILAPKSTGVTCPIFKRLCSVFTHISQRYFQIPSRYTCEGIRFVGYLMPVPIQFLSWSSWHKIPSSPILVFGVLDQNGIPITSQTILTLEKLHSSLRKIVCSALLYNHNLVISTNQGKS